LVVCSNQLEKTGLNDLLKVLHGNIFEGETNTIYIHGNPGTADCNTSLAPVGWIVNTTDVW